MRREDIFMDLIGELDDKYVELAMTRSRRSVIVSDPGNAVVMQSAGVSSEVSRKDLRIYWITHVLGMAAVTFLIVGAAVILIMNWDKIAVRETETAPVVTTDTTTVTEPSVITSDIDEGGSANAPSVTFEEMKNMISYKDRTLSLPCDPDDILSLDERLSVDYSYENDKSGFYRFMADGELICSLTVATGDTDVDIPEGKKLITLAIRSGEDFSLFDGKINLGTALDEVKALLGEPMHNDEYPDYNYRFTSGGETIAINDMRFDDDGKLIQMPDISYIGDAADRFEQITDTAMPEPFAESETNWEARDFYAQWDVKFGNFQVVAQKDLIDMASPRDRDGFLKETEKFNNIETPYTLFDNVNDLSCAKIMELSGGELADLIAGRNIYYNDLSPTEYSRNIYSEEDINMLVNGKNEEIAAYFASEFSIVVGENVFCPEWLYYHTIEDYEAVGITPGMVGDMLLRYQELGLPEETWKAFREKLVLYCAKGLYDGSAAEAAYYLIETDNAEPFGDRAFEILENVFYGDWELAESDNHNLAADLSFTYSKDPFKHEGTPVWGIYETDEIYVMAYSNFGVANSYVIKKSEPDVMYEAELLTYNVGAEAVKLTAFDMKNRKYINRKAEVPGLKSGELSVLGEKKLLHTYGKTFEDSFNTALEKDKSEGIETGMGTAYSTYKDIYSFGYPPRYLADLTEDTAALFLPYYCEKDGTYTVMYAEKIFMRNYKDEWDAVSVWTDEGIVPIYGSREASGTTIPVGMLGEFDLDTLTGKVFSENSTFISELNSSLDGISDKELIRQYRRAVALATAGCRDMSDFENTDLLRQYYGEDFESSGKRAEVYGNPDAKTDSTGGSLADVIKENLHSILSNGSGAVLGRSSGYSFVSVMNAYLRTFSASYINDVFPKLPFCRVGDELFYRDVSSVIPDLYYEFDHNLYENRAVFAIMGYEKDKATGGKTGEIVYGGDAIFEKSAEGWKCTHFSLRDVKN